MIDKEQQIRELAKELTKFKGEIEETLFSNFKETRTQALKDCIKIVDKSFETLHGGGNARRLLIKTRDNLTNLIKE